MRTYGLFKAVDNLVDKETVRVIVVVGCGPYDPQHEINGFLKRYPNSTIYAFEPEPENFASLAAGLRGNRRVALCSYAVTDKESTIGFHVNHPIGAHSILPWNDESEYKPKDWVTKNIIHVPACSLDQFCNDHDIPSIDILFMDAQGAEGYVIAGATELWCHRRINIIVGEAIFADIYKGSNNFLDVYNQLVRLYEFYGFYRPVYGETGKLHHCDFVFRRMQGDGG